MRGKRVDFWGKANAVTIVRGFCKVYELGGYSRAASILTVSQSALTRQVQSLEGELGVKFFNKSSSGRITPTKDGTLFYNLVKPRIQSIDCVHDYFKKRRTEQHNKLIRVSAHHTNVVYILPSCIKMYRNNYNDNETEFIVESSPDLNFSLAKLDDDEIDFVMYPMSQALGKGYCVLDLISCEPTVIMHRDNALAKKNPKKITFYDLAEQNFLFMDKTKITPLFTKICDEYNITGNIKFVNSDWETVRNFVKLNLGVHLYSDMYNKYATPLDPELVSKSIGHLFPPITTKVITKNGAVFSRNKEFFLKVLKEFRFARPFDNLS
jgi:DNA-binding transcriptional LysR family regulator